MSAFEKEWWVARRREWTTRIFWCALSALAFPAWTMWVLPAETPWWIVTSLAGLPAVAILVLTHLAFEGHHHVVGVLRKFWPEEPNV